MISLTKIGNLKIGVVNSGKPIALERILVTMATKENKENFKVLHGFKPEGEESVVVTLPFDDLALNFETNYVTFVNVNSIDYIAKAANIGDDVLLYPLDIKDFDKPILNFGELTEDRIKTLEFKYIGFLKAMIPGVSGFGEVFYFKTGSLNSIRSIQDQLTLLSTYTGGKIAGLPLRIKPYKKDVDGKEIVFVSISFAGDIFGEEMKAFLNKRAENDTFKCVEDLYRKERDSKEVKKVLEQDEIKKGEIPIFEDTTNVITEEGKEGMDSNEIFVRELVQKFGIKKVPVTSLISLKEAFDKNGLDGFEDFVKNPKLSVTICVKKIKELGTLSKGGEEE